MMTDSYLDQQWTNIRALFGEHIWMMTYFGVVCGPALVALTLGGFYLFLDVTGKPSFLAKYKVQSGKNTPLSLAKLGPLLAQVAFNILILNSIFSIQIHPLMVWRGCSFEAPLPSLLTIIIHLTISIVCEEIGFYYSHRLFHNPILYKHFHKKHHEWTSPIALEATYCHPLEHIISNLMPIALGPLLMGSHMVTVAIWAMMATIGTLQYHSGYHFPLMLSPQFHDFHHLKFTCNFGVLGLLDHLHGTDVDFKHNVAHKRHRFLLSLTPIHKLFPEINKALSSSRNNKSH